MTQVNFWGHLFFGYFYIIGEEYLFALMSFIILAVIFACLIRKFLIEY